MTSSHPHSASIARSARRFPAWPDAPRIVAESLRALAHPPLPLESLPERPASLVAVAMARSALPCETSVAAPAWLLPEQVAVFRRALAALSAAGGALIAEPTGAGKTYIALAVAAASSSRRPVCIVPASVAAQWSGVSERIGVPIVVWSQERASRGQLPAPSGLVVIDESHRFRNQATRRYTAVARWLVGQTALLLTATPTVNRLGDIAAQLALALRDDVLAPWGLDSLATIDTRASLPDAAARVILRSTRNPQLPARRCRLERPERESPCINIIERLTLSTSTSTASLIRGVLFRAAASSPAALAGALRRYRLLLLHAGDAGASGVKASRAALRSWLGSAIEQTVLWSLVGSAPEQTDLELSDLAAVEEAEEQARAMARAPDARVQRVVDLLRDGRRTIVFSGWRDTVRWIRERLPGHGVAWCTGSEAGLGRTRTTRQEVLGLFRPGAPPGAPQLLITSDVASEGLDLQAAGRVVHFDLPWTPMRLTQRDGRAVRIGNPGLAVDIIRFDPPRELDARIRQTEILRWKGELPVRARLTGAELHGWRTLVEDAAAAAGSCGIGVVAWEGPVGALAAVEVRKAGTLRAAAEIVWLDRDGSTHRDPARLGVALRAALACTSPVPPHAEEREWLESRLSTCLREALRRGTSSRWARMPRTAECRALIRRLGTLARAGARARNADLIRSVDRALRFAARGHTAGEAMLVRELSVLDDAELLVRLPTVPDSASPVLLEIAVRGVVLFRSVRAPLR